MYCIFESIYLAQVKPLIFSNIMLVNWMIEFRSCMFYMDRDLFQDLKCIFKMDFIPLYQNFAMASSIRVSFIIFAVVYEWLSVLLPDKSRNMSSHCHLTLQFDLTLQDTHLHSLKRLFRALLLEKKVRKSIYSTTIDSKFGQLAGIFE